MTHLQRVALSEAIQRTHSAESELREMVEALKKAARHMEASDASNRVHEFNTFAHEVLDESTVSSSIKTARNWIEAVMNDEA